MFALLGSLGGGFFNQNYRAYPVAFLDKGSADKGDKLILPPSALQTLASMHVQYPMLFRVTNKREGRHSHCGVLEFVAEEGVCYMPQWVMDNLLLGVGDLINLANVSLPKGTFIKIQPHSSDFLEISNPKAVLETSLRSFTCLTEGDTIVIDYNGKFYYIDILEVKPDKAVSVIETDVNVDFAPPKDYKEPDYNAKPATPASTEPMEADGGRETTNTSVSWATANSNSDMDAERNFVPFRGSGRRLDGKGSFSSIAATTSSVGQQPSTASEAGQDASMSDVPRVSSVSGKSGKVVFGGDANMTSSNRLAARLASQTSGVPSAQPEAPSESKAPDFVPFAGKAHSLKD
jgi:ubiquitin fusion degradation protein 1